MLKSGAIAALLAAFVFPSFAAPADRFDHDMNTMWEVLWHQSGTATRMLRWEQDIKVRVGGAGAAAYRQRTVQALREVAAEAGVKVVDVTDQPAQPANVHFEVMADDALSDNQPCQTQLDFETETTVVSALTQMRGRDALRCVYHEAMHVMGVRGHPEGDTVLSYFTTHRDGLLPLDKAMLHAWYSPRARAGMTPFEMLPILADQLVAISPDKAAAAQARDRFLARTVHDMEAFAQGTGDVPEILKRCGKVTEAGVKLGRREMSYFLGVAYQDGVTVAKDESQAVRWLRRAGELGSRSALQLLAGAGRG